MPKLMDDFREGRLVRGQKYRITYKSSGWKYSRTAVMSYLSRDKHFSTVWNARPFAGTQDMPDEWVQNIELVDNSTEPYMHRRA